MAGNKTDAAENLVLDWLNVVGTPTRPTAPLKARLMTALGSDATGGTEVTGGSYVAQSVTMGAAASGSAANTGALTFTGMPVCDILGVEIWDSAGTPVRTWHGPLAGGTFAATDAGDVFTAAAHGMANGTKVAFKADPGQTLPTGITANTVYFVVGQTTNTFQVAATSGGSAIALTSDGTGVFIKVQTIGTAGGSFTIAIGALTTSED